MNIAVIKGEQIRYQQCHVMVLTLLFVGHFIRPTVQYRGCGPRLANAVELVCEMRPGINNEGPGSEENDDARQIVSLVADQARLKKSSPFVSKRTANEFLSIRSRRGIVDECCRHDCKIEELEEYCPPVGGNLADQVPVVKATREANRQSEPSNAKDEESTPRKEETLAEQEQKTVGKSATAPKSNRAPELGAGKVPVVTETVRKESFSQEETFTAVPAVKEVHVPPSAEPLIQSEGSSTVQKVERIQEGLTSSRDRSLNEPSLVVQRMVPPSVEQFGSGSHFTGKSVKMSNVVQAPPPDANMYKVHRLRPKHRTGASSTRLTPFSYKVLESINRSRR